MSTLAGSGNATDTTETAVGNWTAPDTGRANYIKTILLANTSGTVTSVDFLDGGTAIDGLKEVPAGTGGAVINLPGDGIKVAGALTFQASAGVSTLYVNVIGEVGKA